MDTRLLAKKKKKRMDRGELGPYDPVQAKASENRADRYISEMVDKNVGVTWTKKRRK